MTSQNSFNLNKYEWNQPHNPEMRSFIQRLRSFREWTNRRRPTSRQIASAGFFYLGIGEQVKCFYCNGGLQDWSEGKDPWVEHAKWFPTCGYLIRTKGPFYIGSILHRHRASIQQQSSTSYFRRMFGTTGRLQQTLLDDATRMGFAENSIAFLTRRKFETTGEPYTTLEALVSDLQEFENAYPHERVNNPGRPDLANGTSQSHSRRTNIRTKPKRVVGRNRRRTDTRCLCIRFNCYGSVFLMCALIVLVLAFVLTYCRFV